MRRVPVTSSAVTSIGYDEDARTLEVEYAGGNVYQYHDVPPEAHQDLMAADSHGKHVNARIKGVYAHTRKRGAA